MTLDNLVKVFADFGCHTVFVKRLALNDNSKNQPYFGSSLDILNYLPGTEIVTDNSGKRKRENFKSKLDFSWINQEGESFTAPYAQLILYPDYPEVRFSGFLKGCERAPSILYKTRVEDRILFLGVSDEKKIFGYTSVAGEELSESFLNLKGLEEVGVFFKFNIARNGIELNAKERLLADLRRIHFAGWIDSKRLTPSMALVDCSAPQCGGYTLEAELGIPSNSIAEPDYLGWEVKQFAVSNFTSIYSKVITLMDHSPDLGYFRDQGAEEFLIKYGYPDRRGREARTNFGGVHKFESLHSLTGLRMIISGYNGLANKISDPNGYLALLDSSDNMAAGWSFKSIIQHWTDKHANACYVPSMTRIHDTQNQSGKQYRYGDKVILGSLTDVNLLFKQIVIGSVYYDPGIKLEAAISDVRRKQIKVRSPFRIKSGDLKNLYHNNEIVVL